MLRLVADNLWVADQPVRIPGIRMGTRMTVVRLPDGRLWVHSPIRVVPELKAQLDALGPVAFAVGPNRFHHLFLGSVRDAYPDVQLWGAPGLPRKRLDLPFAGTLRASAEPDWADVLEQHPMEGCPRWGEVEFFHRPSRTLITTDLFFNMRRSPHFGTRLLLWLDGAYGKTAVTRLVRLLVRDKTAFRASLERVLAWDFERILLAHGEILLDAARQEARTACRRCGLPALPAGAEAPRAGAPSQA